MSEQLEFDFQDLQLGAYAAADLPNIYLDYTRTGATMELFVRRLEWCRVRDRQFDR